MSTNENRGVVRWLAGQVPTLVVLLGLAAVGVWGVTHDWKLPSTHQEAKGKEDWCTEHNVPEDICVMCKPEVMPRPDPVGWCRTHGVHECVLCNPHLAELDAPYSVNEADLARAKSALEFAPRPPNDRKDTAHERLIQFTSLDAYDRSGVEIAPVFQGAIAETSAVHGEITHDPARVAHVASRAPGSVWRVFKHLGDAVKEGDVLALVDAAPVGQAKAEYQQWLAHLEVRTRTRAQIKPGDVPAPTVTAADAAVREARIKLTSARQALINLGLPVPADDFKGLGDDEVADRMHFLGIPEENVRGLDARTSSNNLLPIRSPVSGTVTSRDVVAGEVVDPAKMLFEVVDNSVVWLTVGVRSDDSTRVRVGQTKVRFEPDGYGGEVEGVVAWMSTEADHKTRTVRVRVNVPNADAKLRANTFGHGRVVLREEPNAVLVPNEAVHVEAGNHYVFVRDRRFRQEGFPKVFHTRSVRIGARDERNTEVIAGVLPGEFVATRNSTVLMAELLRGKLGEGEGCCGGHHHHH